MSLSTIINNSVSERSGIKVNSLETVNANLTGILQVNNINSTGPNITITSPDVIITGNLDVRGDITKHDELEIKDSLIKLADGNTAANAVDIGFYGEYNAGNGVRYAGFYRDFNNSRFKVFNGLITSPTNGQIGDTSALLTDFQCKNLIGGALYLATANNGINGVESNNATNLTVKAGGTAQVVLSDTTALIGVASNTSTALNGITTKLQASSADIITCTNAALTMGTDTTTSILNGSSISLRTDGFEYLHIANDGTIQIPLFDTAGSAIVCDGSGNLSTQVVSTAAANDSIISRDGNGSFSSNTITTPGITNAGNMTIATSTNNGITFNTNNTQKLKVEADGVLTVMDASADEGTIRLKSKPGTGVNNLYFSNGTSDLGQIKYYNVFNLLELNSPGAIRLNDTVTVLNVGAYLATTYTGFPGYLNLICGDSSNLLNLYEGKVKIDQSGLLTVANEFTYMTNKAANPTGTFAMRWTTEEKTNSNIITKFAAAAGDKFRFLKTGIYNITLNYQSSSDMYAGITLGADFGTPLTPTSANNPLLLAFKRKLDTYSEDTISWTGYINSPYELTIQMNTVINTQVNVTNDDAWRLRITYIH